MKRITDSWKRATGVDVAAPTQFSLRPTIRMTAQINALMRMYPGKNKTDLMNDLMSVGISKAIEEITGDLEYYEEKGEFRQNIDDYNDNEEGKLFVTYYQQEVAELLQKVDELAKQKGGKSKKSG